MRTRTFRLTDPESNALQTAYLHCPSADTKIRYQAVRLYGLGYPVVQILDICGCSRTSLMEWSRAFRQKGVTALVDHRMGGNHAKLRPHQLEHLKKQLHQYTPGQLLGQRDCVGGGQFWSLSDLANLLERDYGVVYQSPTSLSTLMTRCEFSYQRTSKQYKSRSEAKVLDFEQTLEKKR
jgi:transposase